MRGLFYGFCFKNIRSRRRRILLINVRSCSWRKVRRKARNNTVDVEAIPTLNRAIKLASFMTPFTPLLNNGEPTTSQGCNQTTGKGLKHKLA